MPLYMVQDLQNVKKKQADKNMYFYVLHVNF